MLTSGSKELNLTSCEKLTAGIVIDVDYIAIDDSAKDLVAARNTLLLPWFLTTCGAVIASCWEAYQHQIRGAPQELLARSYVVVRLAVARVLETASVHGCSAAQAASVLAVEAVANSVRARGMDQE